MIQNSSELFSKLLDLGYPKTDRDAYWWPNSGSFEVVIGAILTQNTKWSGVEKALTNLRDFTTLNVSNIADIDQEVLAQLIKPSGFYNTKAKRLKELSRAIEATFGDFETFKENVTRKWLLEQKGVGLESADSILCYACYKEEMVADKYTHKLLCALGYELDGYDEIKEWLSGSVADDIALFSKKCNKPLDLVQAYALFHGSIVEFSKDHKNEKAIQQTLNEGAA